MNTINITDETVEIEVEGLDKLWSLKSKLTIPRKAINKVYIRPKKLKPPSPHYLAVSLSMPLRRIKAANNFNIELFKKK